MLSEEKKVSSDVLLSQIAIDLSHVKNESVKTSVGLSKVQGLLEGWQIPEFKSEVFNRLHTVEGKVDKMNGGKIEKLEAKVGALEIKEVVGHKCEQTEKIEAMWTERTEKRGVWKFMLLISGVVAGSGAAGFAIERMFNYVFGGK